MADTLISPSSAADLLTRAVGDIAAALTLAGKEDKIADWTAPYVAAINHADGSVAVATEDELKLRNQMAAAAWIKDRLGRVALWAFPFQRDSQSVAAMKKAARIMKQIDADKCWCSSDVEETLAMLEAAIAGSTSEQMA